MKKYMLLLFAMLSLNISAMEMGKEKQEAEEVCHIESIPDELLIMIIEEGIRACFMFDDEGKIISYERNDLARSINKILDFFGTIELVCKRFKRCEDFIIRTYGIAELDDELSGIGESNSALIPNHFEVFAFLSSTMKIKAIDFLIKLYKGLSDYLKHGTGKIYNNPLQSHVNKKLKNLLKNEDLMLLTSEKLTVILNDIIILIATGADPNLIIKYTDNGKMFEDSLLCIGMGKNKKWRELMRFLLFRRSYFLRELDLNHSISKNCTPLFAALGMSNYDLAKWLLKCNVDLKTCNDEGKNPLLIMLRFCFDVDSLIESGILTQMLEQGIDVNAYDNKGSNALYQSILIKIDASKIVNLLCQYGLRLNDAITIIDSRGHSCERSPLGWAIYWRNREIVQFLINKGVNLHGKYKENTSALEYAKEYLYKTKNPKRREIFQMIVHKERQASDLGAAHFCALF